MLVQGRFGLLLRLEGLQSKENMHLSQLHPVLGLPIGDYDLGYIIRGRSMYYNVGRKSKVREKNGERYLPLWKAVRKSHSSSRC